MANKSGIVFTAKKLASCYYCEKPVTIKEATHVYLAHGNGGAYDYDAAHKACHESWPCSRCKIVNPKRNSYGWCDECGCDKDGHERPW